MAISVFDLFKIGIGPSSSHTGGPMAAAHRFARGLFDDGLLEKTASVRTILYGSLGLTGKGHGSDKAVMLGLEGDKPELVDVEGVDARLAAARESGVISLFGDHEVPFVVGDHLVFERKESLPHHPNGMRFTAYDASDTPLREKVYYSVGGGFVVDEDATGADRIKPDDTEVPYPFATGADLLSLTRETGLSIPALMMENEKAFGRDEAEIRARLLDLWRVMRESVERGCTREGLLPGGLKVRRRAHHLHTKLVTESGTDPLQAMDWVTLFALAVNEENAAGGRIVTAPTNGAAGIVPAVLHYYDKYVPGASNEGVIRFLLTAGAMGVIIKEVENAAEIGIEHNLGLTCDPVGGLVQVPCIERNAVASIKAISASRLALRGDGRHFVSLDKAIKTMRDTGRDMLDKYKETSRGGLAVNVIEC
jgi:L-serine dehydratase